MPPTPEPDSMEDVIEAARGCAIAAPEIRALAERLGRVSGGEEAIDRALETGDPDLSLAIMLASAMCGWPPSTEQTGRVIGFLEVTAEIAVLVGCTVGDRLQMLLDVLSTPSIRDDRAAICLFLAVEIVGDGDPPAELLRRLRIQGRRMRNPPTRAMVGLAAARVDDPGVRQVLAGCIAEASSPLGEDLDRELRRMFRGPVEAVLQAEAPPKVVSGFTARRAVARIGRNEPCPCGSGKKYKHCCWRKDEARRRDPSPVAGLTMAEYRARAGEFMSSVEFGQLRPHEMLALDIKTLPTGHLVPMTRTLRQAGMWEDAERALEEMLARDDLPDEPDAWREDFIHDALEAGRQDIVARQAAAILDPEALSPSVQLALAFGDPAADSLAAIEDAAEKTLRGDDSVGVDLAYALLDVFPALGILVTRSIVHPSRALDAEVLLEYVEEARDRLDLLPGDPGQEMYEMRSDRHYDSLVEEAHRSVATVQNERLLSEVEELRRKAAKATAESTRLERELADATRRADELDRRSAASAGSKAASPDPNPEAGADARALREKIEGLKDLIREGNEERSDLRRQLAELGDSLREAGRLSQPEPDGEPEPDDDLEQELVDASRPDILLPEFSDEATASLRDVPERVARSALVLTGRLAAGEDHAWSGVKSLRMASGLLSARVGHRYRLLFRADGSEGRLVVADFVLRRDLEKAIARHGGT